jgi:hypothetical protein
MKYVANSFNCHISKLPNGFVINRVDQLDSAFAEIVVVTRSGRQHNERVEFALTSVASDIHSKSITVRPIPASEQLLVTLPENTNTTALSTIRLYSHIGALALQSLAQGNELSFDVRGLATGTYALQVGSSFIPVLIVR